MSSMSESSTPPVEQKSPPKKRKSSGFFTSVDREYNTPHSSHPLSSKKYFSEHPPIPIWNIVIDNETLEIVEVKENQP